MKKIISNNNTYISSLIILLLSGCGTNHIPLIQGQIRVKQGDTLESIAFENNKTVAELIEQNNINQPLEVGMILHVRNVNQGANSVQVVKEVQEGVLFGPDAINAQPEVSAISVPAEMVNGNQITENKTEKVKETVIAVKNDNAKELTATKVEVVNPIHVKNETQQEKKIEQEDKKSAIFEHPLKNETNAQFNKSNKVFKIKPGADTTVYSIGGGEAFVSGQNYPAIGGKMVVVKHNVDGQTYISVYGGLQSVNEKLTTNKLITKGEIIGSLNKENGANELHFELRKGSIPIDPRAMIANMQEH